MIHCWASKLEAIDDSLPWSEEYFRLLTQGDEICMLEDGHSGEHDWQKQSDIIIRFEGDGKEGGPQ